MAQGVAPEFKPQYQKKKKTKICHPNVDKLERICLDI
jgi:ubiquitin-protein ligase